MEQTGPDIEVERRPARGQQRKQQAERRQQQSAREHLAGAELAQNGRAEGTPHEQPAPIERQQRRRVGHAESQRLEFGGEEARNTHLDAQIGKDRQRTEHHVRILERARLVALAVLGDLIARRLFVLDRRQLEQHDDHAEDDSENAQPEEGNLNLRNVVGTVRYDDHRHEQRRDERGQRIERLVDRQARRGRFGRSEYQHVRIQRHLKQHDADGHEKHAAEETVEAGLDAEIIQRHAEPDHDYARDQRRLVSDLAQQPCDRNRQDIRSVESRVDQLQLDVVERAERLVAEGDHRVVHRRDESQQEHQHDHDGQRERVVRFL